MAVGDYLQMHLMSLCQFRFHIPLPPCLFAKSTPRDGKWNRFMSQQFKLWSTAVELLINGNKSLIQLAFLLGFLRNALPVPLLTRATMCFCRCQFLQASALQQVFLGRVFYSSAESRLSCSWVACWRSAKEIQLLAIKGLLFYLNLFKHICLWFLWVFNPLTPELNPSAQRCLKRFLLRILLLEPCAKRVNPLAPEFSFKF
jgi:hypothetical protein